MPPVSASAAAADLDSRTTHQLPLSHDLLDYYRQRIEQSEKEYQDALAAVDQIKVSHEDYHRLTWELHQRCNEISKLQASLSQAQTCLFDERKQLLKALADNDELRLQELKDRKKIRYLLSVHGFSAEGGADDDDDDETTYFKDRLEKRFVRPPRPESVGGVRATSSTSAEAKTTATAQPAPSSRVLADTASPDEDDVDTLRLRVKSLKAQLGEQAKMYEETIAGLKQDRQVMLREERARKKQDDQRIEQLLDKITKLQTFCRENTREMLEVKRAHQVLERRDKEEKAKLLHDLSQARTRLGDEKGRNDNLERKVEIRVVRKNEALVHELRQQVARYEKEMRDQRLDVEQASKSQQRHVDSLRAKIDSLNNSYKTLKQRRDFQVEGYMNEIRNLKKTIETQQKLLAKQAPLEDKELQVLKTARNTGEKASRISYDLHGLKARLYKTERDLHALAF